MGEIHLTIDDLKATGLTCKSIWRSKPNGYVAINWMLDSQHKVHKTQIVKETESPLWRESFRLLSQSIDSTVSFEMFDKGVLPHSYGIVTKTVSDLLADPKQDITFPSSGAILSMTVMKEETDAALSSIILAAQRASGEAPDQMEITVYAYAPLREVIDSLAKLMNIANTLAEIHPLAKVAWSVVFAVYKVVKDQQERNVKIRDLLETMAMLYSQRVLLKVREKEMNKTVVDTIQRILKQTIECLLFIQEHSGKGFAVQAIKNSLLPTTDTRITEFKEAFIKLRGDLDTGLTIQTALICVRLARGVGISTLKSILDPAEMKWTSRPRCHPLTRTDIRCTISEWIINPNASKVLWITGLVGAGKSTLATTVADMYDEAGRLGAFVFFNRHVGKQSNPDDFVPTLAYELSKFHKGISEKIAGAIGDRGHTAQGSFHQQFQYLIQEPLKDAVSEDALLASQGPIIIVIDSLDECGDASSRKQLLKVLATETVNLPRVVRVIVTSRPEPDIHAAFDNQHHIRHEELKVVPHDNDILLYMRSQLQDIQESRTYLDPGWPGPDKLGVLVSRAGGLFIWASTACKYIDSYSPDEAIDDLLQEGFHKGLDDLYQKALEHAGDWNDARLRDDFQDIIGTILVVRNPMDTKAIDKFLKLKCSSKELLSRFASVIHQADNEPVHIFHKSFSDFITDPERCTNSTWLMNISHHEHHAALSCIARMEEAFRTPRHFALAIAPKVDYDEAVKYSCSYWIHHVIAVGKDPDHTKTAKAVYSFMEVHTMHWLEAMSVLKVSRSTSSMLEQLHKWAMCEGTEDLKALAYDAYRFTTFFAKTIAKHPAMITQVALPFAPLESKLYQLFHDHRELPTIIGGYQQKWSPSLRAFEPFGAVASVSFSPDMTKVVSTSTSNLPKTKKSYWVQCWETVTGIEAFPRIELEDLASVQFSSDGTQVWVATGLGSVYVLDADTGDRVSELPWNIWLKKHAPRVSRSLSPSSRHRSSPDAGTFLGSVPESRTPSRPPNSIHRSASLDGVVPESHGLVGMEAEVSTGHDAEKGGSDSGQSSPRAVSLPVDPTEPEDLASGFEVEDDFTRAAFSGDGRWVIFGNSSGKLYVIDRKGGNPAYGVLDDLWVWAMFHIPTDESFWQFEYPYCVKHLVNV